MANKPFAKEGKFALTKKNMTLMAASGALIISMATPAVLAAPDESDPNRPMDESLGENPPESDPIPGFDPDDSYWLDLEELEDDSEPPQAVIPPEVPDDITPPTPPVVDTIVVGDEYITGEAEAGTTVSVTFPDESTATGVTNSVGEFSVLIPEDVELKADHELILTAVDNSLNESVPRIVIVTATAPDDTEQVRVMVKYVDESGNELAPILELTGVVGEAYEALNLDIPGYEVTGNEGESAGVMGKDAVTVTYSYMKIDESVTPDSTVYEPTVSDIVAGDSVVTGAGLSGHTIMVDFGGVTATGTVDGEGLFSIDVPSGVLLSEGDTVTVTATDESGNKSNAVTTNVFGDLTMEPDTEAPAAPIVNPVKAGDNEITGSAEAGSHMIIEFPDGLSIYGQAYDPALGPDGEVEVFVAASDDAGVFRIGIPADTELVEGDELRVTASDATGNISDVTVITVLAADAPAEPVVLIPEEPEQVTPDVPAEPVVPDSPDVPVDNATPDAPDADVPDESDGPTNDESAVVPETPESDNDNEIDEDDPDRPIDESIGSNDALITQPVVIDSPEEVAGATPESDAVDATETDQAVAAVVGSKPGSGGGGDITKDGLDALPQSGADTNWLMILVGSLVSGVAAAVLFMRRKITQVTGG